MKKASTSNTFQDGLLMDLNPLSTPNNVLTNCLNGTLVTYNGNEHVLQNDMGNGRVETAFLPEGYVPLGTTEYGGIIYIVSYNPINKQCQIGSFPSPERNITNDEASDFSTTLKESDFLDSNKGVILTTTNPQTELPVIKKGTVKLAFSEVEFNPGDFYKVYFKKEDKENQYFEVLTGYGSTTHIWGENPKKIKIDIVSVNKDGGLISFKDSLKWYDIGGSSQNPAPVGTAAYYIAQYNEKLQKAIDSNTPINLDEYRDLTTTPYNIFKSRSTGNLALICELELPNIIQSTFEIINLEEYTHKTGDRVVKFKKPTIKFNTKWDRTDLKYLFLKINNPEIIVNKKYVKGINVKIGENFTPAVAWEIKDSDSDEMYCIEVPSGTQSHEYTIDFGIADNIIQYEIYPATDYGIINYLVDKGSIDLSKLGSGEYNITSWQYYNSDDHITLEFFSEIYPKPQEKVSCIYLQFLPISENSYDSYDNVSSNKNWVTNAKEYYNNNGICTLKIEQNTYSGSIVKDIQFKQNLLYGYLIPNNFYKVNVIYEINSNDVISYKNTYKSLYTCPIFNIEYKLTEDFTTLELSKYLTINSELINNPTKATITTTVEDYTELVDETGVKSQNTIFNVQSKNDILISPYLENNFGTFTIGDYTVNNFTFTNKQDEQVTSLINTGKINSTPILKEKTDGTENIVLNNHTLNWDFDKNFDLAIYYTEKEINHNFTNSFQPIIRSSDDIINMGLVEFQSKNQNKNISYFAPSKVMTMFYTDIAGKRAGTVLGIANLNTAEGNESQKYYTQSLDDLVYTSPGYSDNNNTYIIGRNDYKTGESAMYNLEKIGFDDSFDQICNDIGSPIVVCIYASIKAGPFGDDQQLHSVTTKNKSITGNNWLYFKPDAKGISENNGSKTYYQIYIRTDKGSYRPINIIHTTKGTNITTGKNPENVLDNFDYIIAYFMQLYQLKNIAISENVTVVDSLKYYDKYNLKKSRTINYEVTLSDLLINNISISKSSFKDLANLDYSKNIDQSGSISISFNLVNEDLISKKYAEQSPNANTIIYTADNRKLYINNMYSDMTAVYYLSNDTPMRLNDTYSQFVAHNGTITKEDSIYKLELGDSVISNTLNTVPYQMNNGELQLKTSVLSSNTFKLTLEDISGHKGTISKMIDFEPIKFEKDGETT